MNILICPQAFKGSISAIEVANNIEKGIIKANPNHNIIKLPVADGGDDTLDTLVEVTKGKIFDVIVDLRKDSSTFLNFHNEILSENNERSLLVPQGFAHGFIPLDDNCEVLYFHTKNYNPDYERGIRYNDPKLNINWPSKTVEISERDFSFPLLTEQFDGLDL